MELGLVAVWWKVAMRWALVLHLTCWRLRPPCSLGRKSTSLDDFWNRSWKMYDFILVCRKFTSLTLRSRLLVLNQSLLRQ